MKLLIKNGTLVTKEKSVKTDILITDGKTVKTGAGLEDKAAQLIDATGLFVAAGIVDMHVHLRDPGQEYKEDIASGAAAAVKGGVTTAACMPNTAPPIDCAALIKYVKARAKEVNLCKIAPYGCITKGRAGAELAEFGLMSEAGAAGFSDDGSPVENSAVMRAALEYAKDFGALIVSHPEDRNLSADGDANEGFNCTAAGLKGITRAAEETGIARDLILAETFGAAVHICHVSTAGGAELIRQAKRRGVKVTAETCPHYFTLTDKEILGYDTNAKVSPPLRTESDRAAIIDALKDGTLDVIASDHAPHHADDKNVEFHKAAFGISGIETLFALSYTALVSAGHITVNKLTELLSDNPKKILKLPDAPDFIIFDSAKKYKINADEFISKGKNTPFGGRSVYGKIMYTIVDGEVKYKC